ncbi:MAG TPA: 16S rRNA (adenine(1518)-N(6)/adenine(1519)-N(6))-dimethyltransferase RsmA [Verrucomicrobiae bacterium]|nr:16S rRNA (adenine(1518)-N(6)/adenine(1519)-N(6))-dimethyltransferase RsmA [Verrucomicrobiae bacterium]
MKLSEIKQVLVERDIKLTKSLGQSFLHDGNQLRRIVEAAELKPTDNVLEVGPGLGPLTELLLKTAGQILTIEKDRRLVDVLDQRFVEAKNLTLLRDDALDYLRRDARDWSAWKLVANLPYSVASPILVELAQADGCPERLVATLQLEVAQRLMAKAGDDDYGVLTLLIQLYYEPRGWFKIPAACFFPKPDVDSACVILIRRPNPLLNRGQADVFARIVKRGFSQRRKMMFKLLKEDWPEEKLHVTFDTLNLSERARAETVGLEGFVTLAKLLRI